MTDDLKKSPYTEAELEKFRAWALEQESAGKKITVRASKEFMGCGQIKAEALIRQYVDDKTRGVIETAMVVDVPESVLNAMSEYMQQEIKKVVEQMRSQVKEAEGRAAESAENIDSTQQSLEYMTAERERLHNECTTLKAKLDVLEKEFSEYKTRCVKLTEDLQAAKVEAAAAKASLDTYKETIAKTEKAD